MAKSIRDLLEDETTKAETEIRESLQRYHDATGMLPRSVDFEILDVKPIGQDEPRKVIIVNTVSLSANT